MSRPTIHDVARVAGVSLSTVDRVLNSREGVRASTLQRVTEAMSTLGYQRDVTAANLSRRRRYRLCFVLPEGPNAFMRGLQDEVERCSTESWPQRIEMSVETVPAFDAEALAALLRAIDPETVDGVAVVATDSASVNAAIGALVEQGVHVVTLVSDVPASRRACFVGIDNVVAGRTAAGLLGRFCGERPGKVAVVAGSMVVRDHAERRLGFEQVFRAEFPHLEILPTLEGLDDAEIVAEKFGALLEVHPEVTGIYSLGAGNRGVIRALTEHPPAVRPAIVAHELTPHTREALLSGVFDAAINQDIAREVRSAVRALQSLIDGTPAAGAVERIGVEIFLRDNLP